MPADVTVPDLTASGALCIECGHTLRDHDDVAFARDLTGERTSDLVWRCRCIRCGCTANVFRRPGYPESEEQ